MKNIFFTVAILVFLLSSCGTNSNKKTDTHTHEGGSEHVNHDNASDVAPKQEAFEVDNDSLHTEKDTMKNEHENEHSHEDGHEHTH